MRSLTLAASFIPTALLSVLAVACGASSEDTSSRQEQETRVSPDGSDLPASVRVVAPKGAAAETAVSVGSLQGKLSDVIGPLPTGQHQVRLTSGAFATTKDVTVAPSKTTDVEAALLRIDWSTKPTLGLVERVKDDSARDFPAWADFIDETGRTHLGYVREDAAPGAVFAGRYRLGFGIADGVEVDLAEGQKKTVAVAQYAGRRVAKLIAPVRELPNEACNSNAGIDAIRITGSESGFNNRRVAQVSLAPGEAIEVGAASWFPDVTYVIRPNGTNLEYPLPLGEAGKGALEFKLGRLDVDHVAVKQPDGSKKMVAGTYSVMSMKKDAGGNWIDDRYVTYCYASNQIPTNTGIDLPQGKYKLRVSYETAEAGTKTNEYTVDVK